MEVNKATFTFNKMPEVVVGGQKLAFREIEVDGKKIKGAVDQTGNIIARLTERGDGKFDVTVTASSLAKRTVRVEGGALSRLSTREGDKVEKYDIPAPKLLSGKKLVLNEAFAREMTQGLTPLPPKIVIREQEDDPGSQMRTRRNAMDLTSKTRPRSEALVGQRRRPEQDDSLRVDPPQTPPRSKSLSDLSQRTEQDDSPQVDPSSKTRPRSETF